MQLPIQWIFLLPFWILGIQMNVKTEGMSIIKALRVIYFAKL